MTVDRPALVGREHQVRELRLVSEALLTGQGSLVLLAGEAGVGKTRLAEEAVDLARRCGISTRWVTCLSGGGSPPLTPWREVIDGLHPTPPAPGPDGDAARFRLFEETWQLACESLAGEPTLVVFDDYHWADPLSAGLLRFAAPRFQTVPVSVLVTYRDDAPGSVEPVLTDLLRHGRVLVVPPLDLEEFRTFAARVASRPISQHVTDNLHARTGGNALFARELIRLLDAGDDAASTSSVRLPRGVRDVLIQRVQGISPPARDVLAVAAVVGTEFRFDVISGAASMETGGLLDALDEALRARLVATAGVGRWRFTHPLMREAIYEDLGLSRAVRLHQAVADSLTQLADAGAPVAASELAAHLVHTAAAGDAPRAADACELAGRDAMLTLAYEDAARWFESALEALDLCPADETRRTDLWLAKADALVAVGDLPGGRAAYLSAGRLARSLGEPERLGHAALGLGSGQGGFEIPLFDREQIDLLHEALGALPKPSALYARLLARVSVALSMSAPYERRAELAEEAVAVARGVADPSAVGYGLAAWCDVLAGPAHSRRRRDAAEEIISLARPLGDSRLELLGLRFRFMANLELGDVAKADADIRAFAAVAEQIRQPLYSWYAPLWRGMRAAMEGRFDDASRWCGVAAAIGQAANSENAAMLTESLRTLVPLERGETEEALSFFRRAMEKWPDYAMMTRPPLAYAEAVAGNLGAAQAILDQVDMNDYEPDIIGSEWVPALVMLADAVWLVGGHRLAEQLYDALAPFRTHHAVDGIGDYDFGSVERPLGLLATLLGKQDATQHLAAALAQHRRIGASLLVARTLRDAGDAAHDAELLNEAREEYSRLGAPERVREVDGLIARRVPVTVGPASIRRDGKTWTLVYAGRTAHVSHTKGMADLAALLAREGHELHVLDLFGDGPAPFSGTTGPVIDGTAKSQYKQRLAMLAEDIEDADERGDDARSAQLRVERDAIIAQLSAAYGLGGRARNTGDSAERARSAVTQRLRDTIARVGRDHPELGAHLSHSVKTGTFCSYVPERPVGWEVDVTT